MLIEHISAQLIVKEKVQKQWVLIEHISAQLMIADPLTKGLPPKTFKEHVDWTGLGSKTWWLLF